MKSWRSASRLLILLSMLASPGPARADIIEYYAANLLALLLPSCQSPCTIVVHGDATFPDPLVIDKDVRLLGDASRPTFTGPGGAPVIHVQGSGSVVELAGITVTGGAPGIVVDPGSSLRLHVVTVRNNASSDGGGIRAAGAVIADSLRLVDNTSTQGGGGIVINAGGSFSCADCEITGNQAGTEGAGVFCNSGGAVELTNSRIANNTSVVFGGGVEASECTGLTIRGSTLSGNESGDGGGITVAVTDTSLNNVTVTGNHQVGDPGPFPFPSGGLLSIIGPHSISISNSVLAGNEPRDCGVLLISSPTFFSASHDFVAARGNCDGLTLGTAMQTGTDAAPLANPLSAAAANGVFAPLPGSPIVDAGSACSSHDEAGTARPQAGGCDLGAVELPECADEIDDDTDGLVDVDDPQCDGLTGTERPECSNGLDDDGGPGGGDYPNDPDCESPDDDQEAIVSCGLGTELVVLIPLLAGWSRRVRPRR